MPSTAVRKIRSTLARSAICGCRSWRCIKLSGGTGPETQDGTRRTLVARNQELAAQCYRQLESIVRAVQLGPAQRSRLLVFFFGSGIGNIGDLPLLSRSHQ